MKDKIEVWETFDHPLEITEDSSQNGLRVLLDEEPEQIPDEIAGENIEEHWQTFKKEEGLHNGNIPYLESSVERDEDGYTFYMTSKRGFKLTKVMNRHIPLHDTFTEAVFRKNLLSNSTHCHLRTNDDKLVFGRKKDQRDQITGFSGFPQIDEEVTVNSDLEDGYSELDIHSIITRRLEPELGEEIVDNISSMNAVGITFVNSPGLRGTDTDYMVDVDLSTQEAKQRFDPDEQFYDELLTVEFKPESMANFITEFQGDGTEISKYAAGCMYAEACAYWDKERAEVIAEAISTEYDTEFSRENTTDYFKDQQDQ